MRTNLVVLFPGSFHVQLPAPSPPTLCGSHGCAAPRGDPELAA